MCLYVYTKDGMGSGTSVHVYSNSHQEDTNESKVEDGVNQYRHSTCLKVAKLYHLAFTRNLDQQPWSQENEEHHRHKNWPPISHDLLLLFFLLSLLCLSSFNASWLVVSMSVMCTWDLKKGEVGRKGQEIDD